MHMDWIPPPEDFLPVIPPGSVVAHDLETKDPDLLDYGPGWAFDTGFIVGSALAWGDQEEEFMYHPFRHDGGNWRGDPDKYMRWLRAQYRRTDLSWTFANSQYDIGWVGSMPKGAVHDVQIAAPLLDEFRRSYSLDALLKDYMGESKDDKLMHEFAKSVGIRKPKAEMDRMPSAVVGPYAEQDARGTWRLHRTLMKLIDQEELQPIYDLERSLVPMLIDMRRTGVRVDVGGAEELRELVLVEERDAARKIKSLTGITMTAWDIELQIRVLRDEGVKDFPKTEKRQKDGLTGPYLEKLSRADNKAGEIAGCILELRRKNRQRVTFIERLVLEHQRKGRIHAQFNALRGDDGGTVSGRFSSQNPNLQQLPSRDEEAATRIRSLVLPEEGEFIASIDYASQEPRLAVHCASLFKIPSVAPMIQEYHDNPNMDLHQKVADLMGVPRKNAKILNLAQMYGQGAGALCTDLGLPTFPKSFVNRGGKVINYIAPGPEGERLIENYGEIVPFMGELSRKVKERATQRGFIRTLLGRKCRVFTYPDGGDDSRKSPNRMIQGSAADMIKKAMIDAFNAGFKIRITVHDENVFSVGSKKEARLIAEVMNSAVDLVVPVTCDLEYGPNWGACKAI